MKILEIKSCGYCSWQETIGLGHTKCKHPKYPDVSNTPFGKKIVNPQIIDPDCPLQDVEVCKPCDKDNHTVVIDTPKDQIDYILIVKKKQG
jgi:hypothetical protein